MKNRLHSSITLHNDLHVFIQRKGMGKATLEAKLAQQLVGMCHEPMFQVFLDMHKA